MTHISDVSVQTLISGMVITVAALVDVRYTHVNDSIKSQIIPFRSIFTHNSEVCNIPI